MPPAVIISGEAGAAEVQDLAGEDDLADRGHADAQHDAGGGPEQDSNLGAAGDLAHPRAGVREQRARVAAAVGGLAAASVEGRPKMIRAEIA